MQMLIAIAIRLQVRKATPISLGLDVCIKNWTQSYHSAREPHPTNRAGNVRQEATELARGWQRGHVSHTSVRCGVYPREASRSGKVSSGFVASRATRMEADSIFFFSIWNYMIELGNNLKKWIFELPWTMNHIKLEMKLWYMSKIKVFFLIWIIWKQLIKIFTNLRPFWTGRNTKM